MFSIVAGSTLFVQAVQFTQDLASSALLGSAPAGKGNGDTSCESAIKNGAHHLKHLPQATRGACLRARLMTVTEMPRLSWDRRSSS
jgi:hypothetical protein